MPVPELVEGEMFEMFRKKAIYGLFLPTTSQFIFYKKQFEFEINDGVITYENELINKFYLCQYAME